MSLPSLNKVITYLLTCLPLSSTQHTQIPAEFKALTFADPLNAEGGRTIDILIGNDHYAQTIVGNTKKSQDERWIATQSKFGWLLSGPVPNNESSTETTLSTLCQMVDAQPTRNKDLNATLTNFWEINKIPDECNDPEATDVQKHFQDTIEFNKVTGRYNVRLPWKDNKQNLPTNFTLTKKKTKQPATYPKRKTSRAYLQIQRPTARSTQERIYRTSPRSEHTSRCHTLHTPFSSLQGKQHNSYENRLRRFSKNIIYGIKPQRLPSYRA